MRKCKECGQEVNDSVPAIAERHGGYLQRHPELTIHQVIARIQTALDEGVKAATQMESRRYEECLDTLQTESKLHGDTKADRDRLKRDLDQTSKEAMREVSELKALAVRHEAERDRWKRACQGEHDECTDAMNERDRLKTVSRSTSATLQIVRKERDELLELRKHMATPIDKAEIDRLAGSVSMYSDSASRVRVTEVCVDALNTIAGRPLLDVTEDEIVSKITTFVKKRGCTLAVPMGAIECRTLAGNIMRLLRSRCRVVPTEDEIQRWMDEYIEDELGAQGEDSITLAGHIAARLLTDPASGGDADG